MAIITTSRGASKNTNNLAKTLALLIPGSYFERRGKKTIEKLVKLGRKKGHSRIIIISEEKRRPAKLHFISLSEVDWEWLPIEFEIAGFKISRQISQIEVLDGNGKLAELFEFEPEEGDALIEETHNKLMFKSNGKVLLELKVKKLEAET